MAKREELDKPLHCPDCGKNGTLVWSENENPMHTRLRIDPQIVSLSSGFVTGPERGDDRLPAIQCGQCGKSVG